MVTRRIVVALCLVAPTAGATPKPLPFTYGTDTNPKGQGEVEQYIDLVPLYALDSNATRQRVLATELMTEVEVSFVAEGPDRTRVELEHRGLDAYGDQMDEFRRSLDSPGGWPGILERFAMAV